MSAKHSNSNGHPRAFWLLALAAVATFQFSAFLVPLLQISHFPSLIVAAAIIATSLCIILFLKRNGSRVFSSKVFVIMLMFGVPQWFAVDRLTEHRTTYWIGEDLVTSAKYIVNMFPPGGRSWAQSSEDLKRIEQFSTSVVFGTRTVTLMSREARASLDPNALWFTIRDDRSGIEVGVAGDGSIVPREE